MLEKTKKSLTFKWIAFSALLIFILLTIACLSTLQIRPEDLKRTFAEVGWTVLIIGIPFSLYLP
jgi:hypothetical protein